MSIGANDRTKPEATDPVEQNGLTIVQFSQKSSLSLATVRRRIKDGSIPSYQPGGHGTRIIIPVDALDRPTKSVVVSTTASADQALQLKDEGRAGPRGRHPQSPSRGPRPKWMRDLQNGEPISA